jgi:sugar O-acyltransferase (sialic acid O-acetyltransferase NeuD family)
MEKLIPIKIPLLNPNEPEALLASLEVKEGELLETGDVVAVIETTKSTGEVRADADGYLVGLRFKESDTLRAGEILAYIGVSPTAKDPALPPWADETISLAGEVSPAGLRITAPARELALEKGLELDSLPHGPLVTRQMVLELANAKTSTRHTEIPDGENRLVIYGAGGHGCSLAALIRKMGGYEIVGFLDDGYQPGEEVLGLKVLGGRTQLGELAEEGIRLAVNGVGGIGDLPSRLAVYDLLRKAGFRCPTVVHPTAFLEDSTELNDGVQVFPFAYVGTQVRVGYGCIINTGAIVSHDCELSPYVNLSPGATLAGMVTIGEGTLVGMRATVNLNVHIGQRALIGNGATVKADVPDGGVVPAGTIWPPRR